MLFLLEIFNACTVITKFTRIAGKLFSMLIAALFVHEAVKGVVSEFKIPKAEDPKFEKYQFQWLYLNGVLANIFSFSLLYTALKSKRARLAKKFRCRLWGSFDGFGIDCLVQQYPSKVPPGDPRRLYSPLPLDPASLSHWAIIKGDDAFWMINVGLPKFKFINVILQFGSPGLGVVVEVAIVVVVEVAMAAVAEVDTDNYKDSGGSGPDRHHCGGDHSRPY
ncbi:hypothetical protein GIB67_000405 [Kingdonia uniflora]|uniref:Uncharacterized protein n=1 Tax=Kingdonia uniflora TaxID=39325 RepID=A0A7J7MPJ7_9MAGN|nr:hypothetical protein GIB67_000405 [Kingdonia uniflora]